MTTKDFDKKLKNDFIKLKEKLLETNDFIKLKDVKEYLNKLTDDQLNSKLELIINDVWTDVCGLQADIKVKPVNFFLEMIESSGDKTKPDVTSFIIIPKFVHAKLKVPKGRVECKTYSDNVLISTKIFQSKE